MARPTVLVVEPAKHLRELEMEALIRGGFHPCPADGLAKAMKKLETCNPKCAVTAFSLGDGTGAELVLAMERIGLFLPVIGVTGRAEARRAFEKVGVERFLPKPFTTDQLIGAVKAALSDGD